MKYFARLLLLGFSTTLALAQNSTPQLIKLQGSLADNLGNPVSGSETMTFVLYDASTGGSSLATIGPQPVVVSNGLYEVDLTFGTSLFSASSRYIEITVNGEVLNPRVQLVSTPFAYSADKLDGLDSTQLVKKAGDTMTGPLTVQGTIASSTGGIQFPDGTTQSTAATQASVGNTLDQAYNQGGAGAGRTINANSGAVNITGPGGLRVTANNAPLVLTGTFPTPGNALGMQVLDKDAHSVFEVWQDGRLVTSKLRPTADNAPLVVTGTFPTPANALGVQVLNKNGDRVFEVWQDGRVVFQDGTSQSTATQQGQPGTNGTNGVSCWDLNGNGSCDLSTEDKDGSGACDVLDCRAVLPLFCVNSAAPASCSDAPVCSCGAAIFESASRDVCDAAGQFHCVAPTFGGCGAFPNARGQCCVCRAN